MSLLQALLIALIEGLTEFLPISSTGHMILASAAMDLHDDEFVKTFEVGIQLGAILAIVMLYAQRFLQGFTIYYKLSLAFLPSALVGFFAYDFIKNYLFNPFVVAIALILGGVILILIDQSVIKKSSRLEDLSAISYRSAFWIGVAQCFSMIPGTSRAAATIVGGVYNGLDKKQATEFSFLLAVPTMFAATGYELLQTEIRFDNQQLIQLLIGTVVAFISAWAAVKIFLNIIENYGFRHFGYYRILLGLIFLIYFSAKEFS